MRSSIMVCNSCRNAVTVVEVDGLPLVVNLLNVPDYVIIGFWSVIVFPRVLVNLDTKIAHSEVTSLYRHTCSAPKVLLISQFYETECFVATKQF